MQSLADPQLLTHLCHHARTAYPSSTPKLKPGGTQAGELPLSVRTR